MYMLVNSLQQPIKCFNSCKYTHGIHSYTVAITLCHAVVNTFLMDFVKGIVGKQKRERKESSDLESDVNGMSPANYLHALHIHTVAMLTDVLQYCSVMHK